MSALASKKSEKHIIVVLNACYFNTKKLAYATRWRLENSPSRYFVWNSKQASRQRALRQEDILEPWHRQSQRIQWLHTHTNTINLLAIHLQMDQPFSRIRTIPRHRPAITKATTTVQHVTRELFEQHRLPYTTNQSTKPKMTKMKQFRGRHVSPHSTRSHRW